eukprot:7389841-Prymnesium_polylepis.1
MADQLVQGLLRKIVVRVSNVHVRLETGEGDATMAAGATLRTLSITNLPPSGPGGGGGAGGGAGGGGHEGLVRKEVEIDGLAVYVSPGVRRAAPPSGGEAWAALMRPMLEAERAPSHLLQPMGLRMEAWLNPSNSDYSAPQVELSVVLPHKVWLSVQQKQLVGVTALADDLGRAERVHGLRLFGRPEGPPSAVGGRAWWAYAKKATMMLHTSGIVRLSWPKLMERRRQRKMYINWYVDWLNAKGARRDELRALLAGLEDELDLEDVTNCERA